jgi:hypothetical protein
MGMRWRRGIALASARARAPVLARALTGALAATLIFFGAAATARATPFDPQGQDWEGLAQLVHIAQSELGTQRVAVTSTLPLRDLKREDGILLVHPQRAMDVDELSAFMRAGGRVVLLDDYGSGDDLLTRFGIRRVPLPERPAQMLRGNPSFAIAEPASIHPTLHDVAHVVTNHATGVEHRGLSPLLAVRGDGEPDVLLAVAGAVGHGRLIAIGDASIPINAMLRYPGNRALTRALVRYATDDDVWGKRGGTLYVLSNAFEMTGSFGDGSHEGGAVGEVRRTILEMLETLEREGLPAPYAYLAALTIGLGVAVWTSTRVGRTHRPVSPRFVRPVPAAQQGGVAGHAALLGGPDASRALAMVELKSALEEQLATRLGLDRAPSHEELVAKVRAAGLLGDVDALALSRLLAELGRVEAFFTQGAHAGHGAQGSHGSHGSHGLPSAERIRVSRVIAVAARVRELIDLSEGRDRRRHE